MQSIALLAIVIVGTRASCGEPEQLDPNGPRHPPDARGGFAGPGGDAPEAPIADSATLACFDVQMCRAGCEGSTWQRADACVRWADLLRGAQGTYAKRDRIGAREVYRRTCAQTKDALACTRVALAGGLLQDLDLAPDWQDPALAPLGMLAAACAGDRERGELACAALEILAPASPLAREPRAALCPDEDAARPACAATVALEACRGGDPEACYLAANEQLPTHGEAQARLRKLCGEQDRPACLYLFALSPPREPDRKSLVAACSLGDQKEESIASACLARTLIKDPDPRPARFAEFACELGSCQHPRLPRVPPAVLKKSCDAGHVNGCANLIFANRATPAAWRPILEELDRRLPPYVRRASAELEGDEVACELGSLDGCYHASKRLAGKDAARAAQLEAYARRLLEPLAAP